MISFLALLPLLNAMFDYLSIGLTRLLLRAGARSAQLALLFGLIDLIAAGVIFFALGATAIAVAWAFNFLAGQTLYDLPGLFRGLRTSPDQYWWLYLMLFSTLLPTLLHAVIVTISVIAWLPTGLVRLIRFLLKHSPHYVTAAWAARLTLTGLVTAGVVLPVWLSVELLSLLAAHHVDIACHVYLRGLEAIAHQLDPRVWIGPDTCTLYPDSQDP